MKIQLALLLLLFQGKRKKNDRKKTKQTWQLLQWINEFHWLLCWFHIAACWNSLQNIWTNLLLKNAFKYLIRCFYSSSNTCLKLYCLFIHGDDSEASFWVLHCNTISRSTWDWRSWYLTVQHLSALIDRPSVIPLGALSLKNNSNCLVSWLLVALSTEAVLIKWTPSVPAFVPSGFTPRTSPLPLTHFSITYVNWNGNWVKPCYTSTYYF